MNVEGQLAALPPPEPPDDHFSFELGADWTGPRQPGLSVGPDPRVMGGFSLGTFSRLLPAAVWCSAGRRVLAAAKPPASAGTRGSRCQCLHWMVPRRCERHRWTAGKSVTDQVNAVALDPDASGSCATTHGRGVPVADRVLRREKVLRFPVLAHWSFFMTSEGATFETLMEDLDVGLGTAPAPPVKTPATDPWPRSRRDRPHRSRSPIQARRRDESVSTDRSCRSDDAGPAEPGASAGLPADQLRRVVPDGREGSAAGAAFEIGRLRGPVATPRCVGAPAIPERTFGAGRIRELLSHVVGFELPALPKSA